MHQLLRSWKFSSQAEKGVAAGAVPAAGVAMWWCSSWAAGPGRAGAATAAGSRGCQGSRSISSYSIVGLSSGIVSTFTGAKRSAASIAAAVVAVSCRDLTPREADNWRSFGLHVASSLGQSNKTSLSILTFVAGRVGCSSAGGACARYIFPRGSSRVLLRMGTRLFFTL